MIVQKHPHDLVRLVLLPACLLLLVAGTGCAASQLTGGDPPPKTLTAVTVTPSTASFAVAATEQFTASATYSDGTTADVTATATWAIANQAVATITPAGLATAVAPGSTNVTATLNGVGGTAALTVTAAAKTIKSIAISPGNPSVVAGSSQQFTATATYSDGSTANVTTTATWTSGTPSVATINGTGLAAAVAAGSTTITASLNGFTGTAALTVTAAAKTLKFIAISPGNPSVVAGSSQQFTATATYSDNSTANVITTAIWTSGTPSVATINGTGLATAVAAGSTTITASLNGVNGTAAFIVTAAAKTLKSIAISPGSPSVVAGSSQQFTATATYSDNSTANVTTTATWTSGTPSVATINGTGLAAAVAAGSTTITASLNGVTGSAALTVTAAAKTLKSIAISPDPASFAMGSTQQFTATATYTDGTTANVSSTAAWSIANEAVATINSTGFATPAAAGSSTVTASLNGVSGSDAFTVQIAPGSGVNVTTWHVDNNRSGLNAGEQSLSPSNVSPSTFGKLFSYLVDGYAYAEPLLVSNVTINGSVHNVIYVATEHDSVYAFDADNYSNGTPLWHVSLLQPGETPVTNDPDLQPYDGITSTPVIDPASKTIYVVSKQKSSSGGTFRLSALDIATGAQKFGGPVTVEASMAGTNPQAGNGKTVSLTTACIQRTALLLANGNVYIGFGNCPTGWLLAYNAQTLAQVGVFNASPNLPDQGSQEYGSAGGIWMGSGGPAADSVGNVYVATGNGPWDGQTAWGDSVLKFDPQLLKVQDYFTPDDYQYMDCNDADLNSGGLMLIPGTAPTQLMVGGKTGKLYLLNTTDLGKEQAADKGATQAFFFESDLIAPYLSQACVDGSGTYTTEINSYENYGIAAYFNGAVYMGVTPTSLTAPAGVRQFTVSGNNTLTPGTETTPWVQQNTMGTTPFISADGKSNGIMWMIDEGQPVQHSGGGAATTATLRAYDATNLTDELYNSGANSGDAPGYGIKFSSPVVANGKVYISTGHDDVIAPNPQGEIDVYGLK